MRVMYHARSARRFRNQISWLSLVLRALMLATLVSAPWQDAAAGPVTSKQAAAAVAGWLAVDRTHLGEPLGTSVQRVDTYAGQAGEALYYIVYLAPAGFAIVAADDLVEPIVGFACGGKFDPSEDNPLGALVNKDLSARLAHAREAGAASPEISALRAQAKWRQLGGLAGEPEPSGPTPNEIAGMSDVRIAPFTQTTWGQQTAAGPGSAACYNYYTPPYGAGNANNYPAGCVATAMAQVMRYYQFPTTGVGNGIVRDYRRWRSKLLFPARRRCAGGPYAWSNMPWAPLSPTTTQCQAIGALVADAGATVNMEYASGGSALTRSMPKPRWSTPFITANAIKGDNYGYDIGAGLTNMINPNLDARYPVLLGMRAPAGATRSWPMVTATAFPASTTT